MDSKIKAREVSLLELRTELSEIVRRVAYTDEQMVITRNGKPAAVLISMRDFQRLQERR